MSPVRLFGGWCVLPVFEGGAVDGVEDAFLLSVGRADGDVHLGQHGACDAKVGVDVRLDGRITEVDLREVAVLLLGQVERELVVDGQVICNGTSEAMQSFIIFQKQLKLKQSIVDEVLTVAGSLVAGISVVVVGGVALLAPVSGQALGGAEALTALRVAQRGLLIAFAR